MVENSQVVLLSAPLSGPMYTQNKNVFLWEELWSRQLRDTDHEG